MYMYFEKTIELCVVCVAYMFRGNTRLFFLIILKHGQNRKFKSHVSYLLVYFLQILLYNCEHEHSQYYYQAPRL